MDDDKNLEAPATCPEHPTCLFRIEVLEKQVVLIHNLLNGLMKLLIANLTGVILTLLGIIGGLLVYLAHG
jgi:hypothetical protein